MTDNAGKVTEYTYYRDNLLKEVIIKRDFEPDRVFTYTYDLAGRTLAIAYPADSGLELKFDDGSDTEGTGWDADGRLLHMRYLKDGDLYRRLECTYDKTGNRVRLLARPPAHRADGHRGGSDKPARPLAHGLDLHLRRLG